MEQTLFRRGGSIREDNHTIAVWLMSKSPFGKSSPAPAVLGTGAKG
jgi:hypothetical protein